jgi:hypothetical protein
MCTLALPLERFNVQLPADAMITMAANEQVARDSLLKKRLKCYRYGYHVKYFATRPSAIVTLFL